VESPEGWGPSREGARPQVGRSDSRGVLTGCRLQCLSVPAAWAALVPGRAGTGPAGEGAGRAVGSRARASASPWRVCLCACVYACVGACALYLVTMWRTTFGFSIYVYIGYINVIYVCLISYFNIDSLKNGNTI
jgi:hypothetical protein